jgi:hypothetical protein
VINLKLGFSFITVLFVLLLKHGIGDFLLFSTVVYCSVQQSVTCFASRIASCFPVAKR